MLQVEVELCCLVDFFGIDNVLVELIDYWVFIDFCDNDFFVELVFCYSLLMVVMMVVYYVGVEQFELVCVLLVV